MYNHLDIGSLVSWHQDPKTFNLFRGETSDATSSLVCVVLVSAVMVFLQKALKGCRPAWRVLGPCWAGSGCLIGDFLLVVSWDVGDPWGQVRDLSSGPWPCGSHDPMWSYGCVFRRQVDPVGSFHDSISAKSHSEGVHGVYVLRSIGCSKVFLNRDMSHSKATPQKDMTPWSVFTQGRVVLRGNFAQGYVSIGDVCTEQGEPRQSLRCAQLLYAPE